MKRIGYILSLLCLFFAACTPEAPEPSSVVLEGWIDAGGYPVVMIHNSYVLKNAPDSVQTWAQIVEQQLLPFGKVVVSDGVNEAILTGRLDFKYMPPYTYSSIDIAGETGKTYTVTVDYRDIHVSAATTIPPKAVLDSLSVRASSDLGTVSVNGYMSHVERDSYYALFVRPFGDKQYKLCPFGVFSGKDVKEGNLRMTVYNPLSNDSSAFKDMANYFAADDSTDYQLKVARIDYPSYEYWSAYNEHVLTKGMMFVPVYKNIPTNVQGGIGYFCGMGSSIYRFSLLNDTTYRY